MDYRTGALQTLLDFVPAQQPRCPQSAPPTMRTCISAPTTHVEVTFVSPSADPLPPSFHADAPITALIKLTVPANRIPTLRSRLLGVSLVLEQKAPGHASDWHTVVSVAQVLDGQWRVSETTQQGELECLVQLVIPRETLRDYPPSWEGTGKAKGYSVRYLVAACLLDRSGSASAEGLWESQVGNKAPVEILPFSLPCWGRREWMSLLEVPTVARPRDVWEVQGVIMDRVFSPTSVVPVIVKAIPHISGCTRTPVQMLTHLCLKRQVSSNIATPGAQYDPTDTQGYVDCQEIVSLSGWHDVGLTAPSVVKVPFRLMPPGELGWTHGLSTRGTVRSERTVLGKSVKFTVKFVLELSVVFVPATTADFARGLGSNFPNCMLPPLNGWTPASTPSSATTTFTGRDLGDVFGDHCQWAHLPLTIGSVAEAPGARNLVARQYITHNAPDGRVRVYEDWAVTEDEGWIRPPPDYEEATYYPPYVYDRMRQVETMVVADLGETKAFWERYHGEKGEVRYVRKGCSEAA